MLRYFPIALHLRLFGAAGIGYVAGNLNSGINDITPLVAIFSGLASIIGWWLMRPTMRQVKSDIAAANDAADAWKSR